MATLKYLTEKVGRAMHHVNKLRLAMALGLAVLFMSPVAEAQSANSTDAAQPAHARVIIAPVDDAWRAALPRDATAATQAYLSRIPAEALVRSNAYFEGGYWLQLWNFLIGLAISAILLRRGLSARIRDWAQKAGRRPFARDALYGAVFVLASFVISLPMTIYEGYVREHQYGMATQSFGPWFIDQGIGLGVNLVLVSLAVAILYAVFRRAGERWWQWGTAVAVGLLVVVIVIAPVWIDPLFNTYRPLENQEVRQAVVTMAQADGVPANNVLQFDASRQTNRVSANVSGIFGTAAVRLNDNLLKCSLPEIRAVMGHELGHYVMNHIYKFLAAFTLVIWVGFLFAQWAMRRLMAGLGKAWGLQGVHDVASLPLLVAVFSVFMFVATPVTNTLVRVQEAEADTFGLNLSREPNGFAEAQLKLSEYRKPDPGALEEFVFYDHPSVRNRIHAAMQWREAMGTP